MDSDFVSDGDKGRSLTWYVFLYGPNLISWKATLQSIVALSTIEAQYIALSEAVNEGIWLKGFWNEQSIVKIYCDNQSTIHLSKNLQFHSRTKHINVKVHTSENATDMLPKPVTKMKFQKCFELVGFDVPEKV